MCWNKLHTLSPKPLECPSNIPPQDLKCVTFPLIIKRTPRGHWNPCTSPTFAKVEHLIILPMIGTLTKVVHSFTPQSLQLYYQNSPHVDYKKIKWGTCTNPKVIHQGWWLVNCTYTNKYSDIGVGGTRAHFAHKKRTMNIQVDFS